MDRRLIAALIKIVGVDNEVFRYGGYTFDIDKAEEITENRKPKKEKPEQAWLTKFIRIDKKHADSLTEEDLERPVLFATLVDSSGDEMGSLLIDGYHRVYKALQMNPVPKLNIHVLDKNDTKQIMNKDR